MIPAGFAAKEIEPSSAKLAIQLPYMPQAVRDRIAADVREAVADPDLDSKLSAVGQVFNPGTSAEFAQAMDDQLATVKPTGDTLGIRPASAQASGTQPPPTIGAKTAQ